MELIVLLLGELLFAPFIAALILVLELVALGIGGALDLVGSHIAADRPGNARMPRRWYRILLIVAGGLTIGTFGFLLLLDMVWFSGTARWVLDRVERTTGVQVVCDTASGSLFGGSLRLDRVSIKKPDGQRTHCDLTVKVAELKLSIWTLLSGTIHVDSLELQDLRGSFTRLEAGAMPPGRRTARTFQIQSLAIDGLDLQITDRTGEEKTYRLATTSWRSEPLRSHWLPFDILFRTNCVGTLAGSDFEIRSKLVDDGHETCWKATNLPVWYLASELSGFFRLLQHGTVDVQVDDRWRHGQVTEVDSRWRLVFHGVKTEVPSGLSPREQQLDKTWTAALNKLGTGVPLEFRLTFDGSRLTTHGSPEANAAWKDVGMAMVKKLLGVRLK